jgi:hypothetical protein
MLKSSRSIWRRRIERGVTLVPRSWLKCDSKKIFAAAAFSMVAIDGSHNRGASWRGNTKNREGRCSAVGSQYRAGGLSSGWYALWARWIVSADRGAPEEGGDVGAVDWLSGALLLPGLRILDGSEGTSDIGVLGEVVVRWSSPGCSKCSLRTVGRELNLGRCTTVSLFNSALESFA